MCAGDQRPAEARLEQGVVGLERGDLAGIPLARPVAVEIERADRRAQAGRQAEDRADRLIAKLRAQRGPARLRRKILGLDARVADEGIDARPLARLLVRELELARNLVARGDVAQRQAVLGDQHQAHPGAREDARRAEDRRARCRRGRRRRRRPADRDRRGCVRERRRRCGPPLGSCGDCAPARRAP